MAGIPARSISHPKINKRRRAPTTRGKVINWRGRNTTRGHFSFPSRPPLIAMPVNNRWVPTSRKSQERERRKNKRIHHDRLRNIKSSIDMTAPRSLSMKRSGKKREQMLAEKQSNINYNNALLMDKILHVARRKNVYLAPGKSGSKTLNETARKQKSSKIQRENQRLLKTLINVQSQIKRTDLEATYVQHSSLAKKMRWVSDGGEGGGSCWLGGSYDWFCPPPRRCIPPSLPLSLAHGLTSLRHPSRENSMNYYPTNEQKKSSRRQNAIRRLASAQGRRTSPGGKKGSRSSPGGRRPKTAPGQQRAGFGL